MRASPLPPPPPPLSAPSIQHTHHLHFPSPRSYVFLSQFKMALSPAARGGATLSTRTVHGEGADIAVPVLTAISKILAFIREEAVDRVHQMGMSLDTIGWVLTVPAIWDEAAKSFMRLAALEAGLIPEIDSDRLQLALEPEGAVIASALDAPAEIRAKLRVGARVMILDCGGGTVDVTVSELVGANPPKLREILAPSGGNWGGTYVDAEFRKFINSMLLPDGATAMDAHADAAASAAALDAWESAKCQWDPASAGRDKVVVAGLATVCEYVGGAEAMIARVDAYNRTHGLTEGVVYRPRSFSLVIPAGVVKTFFDACVDPICAHMQKLLIEAADLQKPVGFVFLVGGFAESIFLQRSVREALATDDGYAATLIIPAKPVQCVNRGAAVWGLYPNSFITSRISRMTIAVALCERYNPAVHDPVPHPNYVITNATGQWVDNVLVPLVQLGDEIPVSHSVQQEVSPVRDGQVTVNFKLCAYERADP